MDDLISRQAAIDALTKTSGIRGDALKALYDLPPVTPQPKMGRWIAKGLVDSNGNRLYECSECHHSDTQAATMIVPYCWYCGAKMKGDKE